MEIRDSIPVYALLLLLILSAASCRSEIPKPSETQTDGVSSSGDRGVTANMEILGFFEYIPFEDISNDKSRFISLFSNNIGPRLRGNNMLLNLAFAKEGKTDSLLDEPYLEIDGNEIRRQQIFPPSVSIDDLDVSSVSFDLDKPENTLNASIDSLSFTLKLTDPVQHSITVNMSAWFSCSVYPDPERGGEYFIDYTKPLDLDVIMDGARWKHFRYDPVTYKAYYDGSEYLLAYTIRFDSDGGTAAEPYTVGYYDDCTVYAEDLPVPAKDGYLFRGWMTEDGTAIPSREDSSSSYFVTDDMMLHAVYYTEAPAELNGEIYSTYKLSGILRNASDAGGDTTSGDSFSRITQILNEENLFDLMLITLGKTDSFGSSSYIEVDNKRYYRTKNAEDPDGAICGTDFNYAIEDGEGRSTGWSSTADESIVVEFKYAVKITDPDGTLITSIPVHILYASMKVISHDNESGRIKDRLSLELAFTDQYDSSIEIKRAFELRFSEDDGIYGDYFFDPAEYIALECR